MKKLSLLTVTALAIFALAACSTSKSTETAPVEKTVQQSETMQVAENQPMTKIGQWKQVEGLGRLELLKMTNVPTEIVLTDGLVVTIHDVKLMSADNIQQGNPIVIDYDQKQGNIIQIHASVKNDTDKEYGGIFPETLVLSDGIQINHNHSIVGDVSVKPHAVNPEIYTYYFIGDRTTDSVRVFYDSIFDEDGYGISDIKAEETIAFK